MIDLISYRSSLDQMVNVLLQNLALIDTKSYPLAESDIDYAQLAQRIPLVVSGFGKAAAVNDNLLQSQLGYLSSICVGLFCVTIFGLFISLFIFKKLLDGLNDEHEKAKRLLLQIPMDAIKTNYPLQILLRGKAAAKEMFTQHDIHGVRITSDGIPVPVEEALNLNYTRTVLQQSSEGLAKATRNLFNRMVGAKKMETKKSMEFLSKKTEAGKNNSMNFASPKVKVHVRLPAQVDKSAEMEPESETGSTTLDVKPESDGEKRRNSVNFSASNVVTEFEKGAATAQEPEILNRSFLGMPSPKSILRHTSQTSVSSDRPDVGPGMPRKPKKSNLKETLAVAQHRDADLNSHTSISIVISDGGYDDHTSTILSSEESEPRVDYSETSSLR